MVSQIFYFCSSVLLVCSGTSFYLERPIDAAATALMSLALTTLGMAHKD